MAYDYLVTGEFSAVRENGAASGVGVLATYAYDVQGRRTGVTRGNGTTTSYGYGVGSPATDTPWLTTLSHNVAGTAKDVSTAFTSNPAGQIATLTRGNDLYAYTAATNLARSYSVNGLNQTTFYTGTGALLTHDANGNTTNDGTQAYTYTPENQLKTGPAESGLTYDGTGTLYRIGSENTVLRSVGGEIATEHDAATGAIRNRYVTGAGVDEPLVWYGGAGTTDRHWLLPDERGSVVASTDAAGTATINAYDEYGIPAAANAGRFGYTGQYWLPSLGLWYYKARMYAPGLGRFLQTDPIGYDGGMNLYAYVGGDPVNASDPDGLTAFSGTECTGTRLCQPDDGNSGKDAGLSSGDNGRSGGGGGRWVPSTDPSGSGYHRSTNDNGLTWNYYYIPFDFEGEFGGGFGDLNGNDPENRNGDIVVVAYRGKYHDVVAKDLASFLNSQGVQVVREFGLCLGSTGVCARPDIFGVNPNTGQPFFIEVKTGLDPRFTPNQLAVYSHAGTAGAYKNIRWQGAYFQIGNRRSSCGSSWICILQERR